MMVNGSRCLGTLFIVGMLLTSCGDGVSNLLGTETAEPSKFEGVDDGVKAKFTKIESIKPNETLTLKVELFSFLSNDALSLTNLSPLSFVPSEVGVEDAPEGELRYTNGFVSRVKLLNPLSCGKFILTDLKIILCPGSVNVAFTSSQNPSVSIGTSLDNMFEVGAGAKGADEFSDIEEEVSVALSDDLDRSEQASESVASTESPVSTSESSTSQFVLGKKPQSHTSTEVSIVGRSAEFSAKVAFAKDYIAFVYIDHDKADRKIKIYNKDFSQGFSLLKEYNFSKIFEKVNALGVSSDGKRIFVAGKDRNDINATDVVLVEVAYDKASNTFGTEKSEVIANGLLGEFNNDPLGGFIHAYTQEGNANAVKYVGMGRSNAGYTRLFAISGGIGSGSMSTVIGLNINPGDALRAYTGDVFYKDGVATSYFIQYQTAEEVATLREALIKVGPAPVEIQRDYGAPSMAPSLVPGPVGAGFHGAYYLDGVDILATYSASPPTKFGLARLEPDRGVTWQYEATDFGANTPIIGSAYDAVDTGNLVIIQSDGNETNPGLKIKGIKLSY